MSNADIAKPLTLETQAVFPASRQIFKPVAALQSETLRLAFATWQELAADRFAPSRREVSPARFKVMLASIFLVEVVDDAEDFKFVLGGQKLIQFMGGRHAGRYLSGLPKSEFYDRMRRIFTRCASTRLPVAIGPIPTARDGREYLSIELIVLPLSDDGVTVTGLLGVAELSPPRHEDP